ncbi:hypothetical protein P9D43_30245 [Neobacillus niacini]|uniref:hypothetical protein n=1 Tax=Neobacillus niacini TaxID=86668 RepID=UPI000A5F70D0|nr:hypothetical protein [Neobacillus niacini]MEC1526252.1 hypothetical protein [Neobacillus niacini]
MKNEQKTAKMLSAAIKSMLASGTPQDKQKIISVDLLKIIWCISYLLALKM